jgi:hypothetical protein
MEGRHKTGPKLLTEPPVTVVIWTPKLAFYRLKTICIHLCTGGLHAYRWSLLQVSLVAPTVVTHSYNTNQRVIFCKILTKDLTTKILTARAPPNANIAPPQQYMLFLLMGKTHSPKASWVRLG